MSGITKLGAFLGTIAVILCILAGATLMCPAAPTCPLGSENAGIGLFFIGCGLFFASRLILTGNSASAAKSAPRRSTPAKGRPAPAKRSAPKPGSAQNPQQSNKVGIYAGNLSPEATEDDLRRAFEPFGEVASVNVVIDKFTKKSKGFGFVEMPVKEEAASAIEALNGHEMAGRKLSVNVAKSMPRKGGSANRRPRPSSNS
jgi:hypothetical protein